MIMENLGNQQSIQQPITIWPFISVLKAQVEVDAIFSKVIIGVWEHIELYSHRLKYVYFVSDTRTRACTSRALWNFQSPVTNSISFDPTKSYETGTRDTIPILQVKIQISAALYNLIKVGKLVVIDCGDISVYFCLGTILFAKCIFKG